MKTLALLTCAVMVLFPWPNRADDKESKKVRVFVQSTTLSLGSLANDLKTGKKITSVEIKEGEPAKVDLSDIAKGKDEVPKTGTYHQQKIMVFKGTAYKTYDAYFSAPLRKGTKLKDFVYKGTFSGTLGGDSHKFTMFEATPVQP
jgi:hypothetical protein